ncbi:MAG TPA: hypothetical protein PK402_11725 [Tepidisphaeraceae bacterium]|nr:hypothetical protein [Tepidisphaeraceae bacterium]
MAELEPSKSAPKKICRGCKQEYIAFSERCPHCGKDSKIGTQQSGVFFTFAFLLLMLPVAIIVLVFILT